MTSVNVSQVLLARAVRLEECFHNLAALCIRMRIEASCSQV